MKNEKSLQNGSNRVFYEYWMLHYLTEILEQELLTEEDEIRANIRTNLDSTGIIQTSSIRDKKHNVINNALIEAFGIHARSLLDFFYGLEVQELQNRMPHSDDIFAEDYFRNAEEWRDIRPPKPEDFDMIRRRVNKEIAHITIEGARVQPESKKWLFVSIKKTIENAYITFEDNALKERLGMRWEGKLGGRDDA